jgi:putative membrane protein
MEKEKKELDYNTEMAVERTELAYKRTQLAWVRTVFTLITAGIALDQVMRMIHKPVNMGAIWIRNGNLISILLASIGSFLLILETLLYIRRITKLRKSRGSEPGKFSSTVLLSFFVIMLGALVTWLMIVYG